MNWVCSYSLVGFSATEHGTMREQEERDTYRIRMRHRQRLGVQSRRHSRGRGRVAASGEQREGEKPESGSERRAERDSGDWRMGERVSEQRARERKSDEGCNSA